MAPLEEPGIGELFRTLSAQLNGVSAQLASLQAQMANFVTQEQRQADKDLDAERRGVLVQRQTDLEAKAQRIVHWMWTVVIGPTIVGVVFWLLNNGGS